MSGIDPAKLDNINTLFQHKPRTRARSIAYEKVAVHGYHTVEQELYKHVVNMHYDSDHHDNRQMGTRRVFFAPYRWLSKNNYSRVTCTHQECRGQAALIECGNDGSGLYVSPKKRFAGNGDVSVKIEGHDAL